MAEDGEDDLGLSLGVEFEDVTILGNAVNLILEYDGGGEFVGILDDCSALLQPLHMHLAVHNNILIA